MKNWCTQKWKNDKSKRFRKTKKHKIAGSRYNEQKHIYISFGMCLAAILLFASLSVASATNYMPQDCYSFTIESPLYSPVSDPNGPYTGTEGVPIDYDGSGSYDPDGSIVAYGWDFGDGDTGTGVAPTHTYAQDGTYTVTLTVTDNDDETNTSTTTATVADTEPTADFSASPTSGPEPLTVTFTDNTTSHDGIVTWNWDFDNDGMADSTEQNPTYAYTENGVYSVCLTVTESDGDSDTMTKTDYITVTKVNNAPYKPTNPSPSDGATEVAIDEAFSWTGGDPDAEDTVTYDVYFGTSITPQLVAEHQSENTYDPGMLDHRTEYYWRIVATDNHGTATESEVWSFVTATLLDPDLVADWNLDEGSGTTAVDSSGNGNDGTLVNNPAWVTGKVGKGLSFDGTNDYINCGQGSSLKITGAITVEAWVKWMGAGNPYFVTKTGGPGRRSFDLSGNEDGTVEFRVGGADCNSLKSSGTISIPNGEWVHLVGTYEPSSYVRLFVDGALAKENIEAIPASQGDNGLPWYIGAREGNQGWFNGIIDEVKIYNGALSAEEIRANYEAYPSNLLPAAIIDSITPDPAEQGKDTVSFSGHGTDTDGSVVAYNWSSSIDGQLSIASSFSKPASELSEGTHAIYFKVQDDNGAWSTEVTEVLRINQEPENLPPVADPKGPYTGTEGVSITFDGSTSSDPDSSIDSYLWDFGDGNTSSEVTPTQTYAHDGTYTVALKVTDNDGAISTSTTTATVADTEPTADFSAMPTSGPEPLTVTFTDNTTSHDGIVTWNWDFDNDGMADSTEQNPTYAYTENGVYSVCLTVTESDGDSDTMTKTDYITVTKVNNAPYKPTNPSPSDGATEVAIDEAFSWTGGDPDAEDTVTYDVYFGTSITPQLVAEHQSENTYDPGMLDHSTEYYWRIVATDNHGTATESEVWSFVTATLLDPDLVADWNLDEGSGTTAVDSSGNGNDGTLVNNPAWVTGKVGNGLSFDGTNDYVDCGQDTSLKITGAITVEAWVKWQGGGNPYIVTKTGRSGKRSYDLSGNEDGTVEFRVGGADCNSLKSSGTISIPNGEWVHLVGTYEPSSYVRLFVDGALAKENTVSIPAAQGDNGLPWYIGAREGNQGWFNGIIDEVKIYNGALSAEEIRANYEAYPSNLLPAAIIDSITPDPAEQGKHNVSFSGHGTDTDGLVVAYNWRSSIDGLLSTASSFSKPASELSEGTHAIYFKVQDDEGAWSTEVTKDLTIIELANQPPVSDQNEPYTGTEGVPIDYDGSDSYDTDGSIVAYEWDFGDGNSASGVTPTHTYAQNGTYTVTLTVTDNDGATDTSTTTAAIADTEPTADFSATPTSGQEPLTVAFTDSSTSYDGIEAREWDLDNDGVIDSTVQNPTYVFAEEGVYTVSLKVTESDGDSDTMTKVDYITVTTVNNDLVAEWHLDEGSGEIAGDTSGNGNDGALVNNPAWVNGKVGKGLSFDGTNDYINCGQGSSLKITGAITVEAWVKWMGAGNPYFVTKTGGPGRRSFDLSGNEDGTVEFRVGGADCNSLKSSGTAPIPTGEWVYLVGTYEPSSYVRLFVNGALAEEETTSIPAAQGDNGLPWYIGAREGNQGWFNGIIDEVKIYHGALSAEEIRANYEAYPSNLLPTAFIDSITPETAEQGKDNVSFSGHGTDTDGSVVAYNWSSSIDGLLSTASSFSKPASELSEGTHAIYFKVQDDNGAWSTEVTEVLRINQEPENLPPVADPKGPYTGTEGVSITFDGSTSSDPDGSIDSYLWDFGDGNTSSEVTPTQTYAQDGTYTVALKVTDNDGAISTSTTAATIADTEPTADLSAMPTSGDGPLTVGFFDNLASYDGIVEWEWDFDNDGVTDSTAQNPTYMYAEEGIYTVSLTVTESDGDCDTKTKMDYISVTAVNNAPYAPDNPSPSDGTTEVPIDEALSWTGGDPDDDDTVTYDVYFGNSMSPPLVAENQPENTYDPGTRGHSTEYYWQIVAKDNHGASKGSEVWGFVTAASPDPDLAAEWNLDEGSGTTAVDSSGNGNDGTLVNNPTWVNGKVGKALSFDGTNDYVDCGQDTSLKITGAIAVEAWVKWMGAGNPYFVTKTGGPGRRSFDLSGNSDGTVEFRVGGADCNSGKSSGCAPIPTGEWVYLVGTYEPSSYVRLFFNGALAEEETASIPAAQGDNGLSWYIGAREGNQGWFDGNIDEVKIHNGALSAEEIRANYEAYPTNRPPVADPSGPYTSTERVAIAYDGSNSYDPDGTIAAYEWDFGDGNTATGVAPTHTYAQDGTYTVALTVTDNDDATNTSTTTATIADTEPTADFSASPTSKQEPVTVTFTDNSASYGGIETWNWDFDNDGETDSTVQNPTHLYAEDGVYTVSLTVTESDEDSDTMTKVGYITVTKVNEPPVADPNGPYTGTEGVPIVYNGSGSYDHDGSIVAYEWDFGDGNTATGVAPTHTYAQDGTYTVALTVTDNDDATSTSTTIATIADTEPTVDFSASPTSGQEPLTVTFTDNSASHDGIVTWDWDFDNDGETDSTELNPTYEYAEDGVYTVSLTVTESDEDSDTMTKVDYITVTRVNAPPEADPNGPYTGTEGVAIAYDGSGSYDPDGSIAAYRWDFGDGNTATGVTPTHTYAQNGIYTVALTVTDNDDAINTSTTTATIADIEPTAAFSAAPTSGQEPLTVTFTDNSASYDGIVTWDWDFDNDGETDSTEQNPTHVYAEEGVYNVSLTITESDEDSDTMTKVDYITVTRVNAPPEADPNGPYTGTEGAEVVYDGSNSYDPDGSIVAYEWDFGDGDTATGVAPTHTYAQDGTYTVALTVTDNDGATNTSTTTATIADTEPTAAFSAARTHGRKPLTVAFTDKSVSYDRLEEWAWDFDNDGVADSTEQNPTHVYIRHGRYTVSLTVRESEGDSGTMTKADYITVIKRKDSNTRRSAPVSPSGGATDVPVDED